MADAGKAVCVREQNAELNRYDYPHCEPCALGSHDHCSGMSAPDKCCCEAPDGSDEADDVEELEAVLHQLTAVQGRVLEP